MKNWSRDGPLIGLASGLYKSSGHVLMPFCIRRQRTIVLLRFAGVRLP